MEEIQTNVPINLRHRYNTLFDHLNQADTNIDHIKFQVQIIRELVETTHLTSAYICRWFPETLQSKVEIEYISDHANHREKQSDLGQYSTEDLSSFIGKRLINNHLDQDTANVFDMALDDPDRQRFLEYGACSICFARIWSNGKLWGYLEMWESRYCREFAPEELAIYQYVADKLGQSLATLP